MSCQRGYSQTLDGKISLASCAESDRYDLSSLAPLFLPPFRGPHGYAPGKVCHVATGGYVQRAVGAAQGRARTVRAGRWRPTWSVPAWLFRRPWMFPA
jgi:hypothetical protein